MAAAGKELSLMIKIGGKIDKTLGSAIANAESQLKSIGKGIDKAMTATIAGVAGAGAALAKESVQTYANYETAITNAAATAGFEKGTAQYEALDAAAQEAGRTTVKTAAESANALEYMALAGWSVEESTKALMPVLKLSAATNMDLATASDLVTDSMSAYGLTVEELPHYLDVLTSANNTANYSAQDLLESYIGSAGMFRTLNVEMMVRTLSRAELLTKTTEIVAAATSGVEQYNKNVEMAAKYEQDNKQKGDMQAQYAALYSDTVMAQADLDNGNISKMEYYDRIDEIFQKTKDLGLAEKIGFKGDDPLNNYTRPEFIYNLNEESKKLGKEIDKTTEKINKMNSETEEFDNANISAFSDLTAALASDLSYGNTEYAESYINQLQHLGEVFTETGKNTDEFALAFAIANQGLSDFNAVLETNSIDATVKDFMEFKEAIGATKEEAVSGAALIKNGFEDAGGAVAKGGDAINAVLHDMSELGSAQGIFDGMASDEALAKISEMANALNLIPDNMSIIINADGNFEAVTQKLSEIGENKIDVTINTHMDTHDERMIL